MNILSANPGDFFKYIAVEHGPFVGAIVAAYGIPYFLRELIDINEKVSAGPRWAVRIIIFILAWGGFSAAADSMGKEDVREKVGIERYESYDWHSR